MNRKLIVNGRIVNRGKVFDGDILLNGMYIEKIDKQISDPQADVIDASGNYILPGIIDDQVHFREPGLTHKADLFTESRAAVAGGITSFMEMPNTVPNTVTNALLQQKFKLASEKSLANYSFYLGATNDNLEEILQIDPAKVCGIKIFMGSSTGNMLVDDLDSLEAIFRNAPVLIATHCEDEETIRRNTEKFKAEYGEKVPVRYHPEIRSVEACYKSSSLAVSLARKFGARLHVLHISTENELSLFEIGEVHKKHITAEACIHHLWFTSEDYDNKGTLIKWNPAVKQKSDRTALRQAVKEGRIDIIATDHAPHTFAEKNSTYFRAPSGGPLVQHGLMAMMELCQEEILDITTIVTRMAHNPAVIYQIDRRGFLDEGFYADIVIVNPNKGYKVSKENLLYKCKWSPFEEVRFQSRIDKTFVCGRLVYDGENVIESGRGMQLEFNR